MYYVVCVVCIRKFKLSHSQIILIFIKFKILMNECHGKAGPT